MFDFVRQDRLFLSVSLVVKFLVYSKNFSDSFFFFLQNKNIFIRIHFSLISIRIFCTDFKKIRFLAKIFVAECAEENGF